MLNYALFQISPLFGGFPTSALWFPALPGMREVTMDTNKVSRALVARLPRYLDHLKSLPRTDNDYISSASVASALGLGQVMVRKDFAKVSDGGHPKTGYLRRKLIVDIENFLGYNNTTDAVLVGAGKLGQALLDYDGFRTCGMNVVAGFDVSRELFPTDGGKSVYSTDELERFCVENGILMGIITVPAAHAQEVCDRLVACGIQAIWNFAPVHLNVPDHILVQNENLASSLTELRMHLRCCLRD